MKELLRVCMGSACYVKGAPEVVRTLKQALKDAQLTDRVELAGRFCADECDRGVVVELPDGEKLYEVGPADVAMIIERLTQQGG